MDQDWPSPPQFSAVKSHTNVFEALAFAQGLGVTLTGQDTPERLGAVSVSSSVFSLLGAQAGLGRVFLPEEDTPGKPVTVILSHGFWQRRLGADPKALGKPLTLNGNNYTIVGVMPAEFSLGNEVLPTVGAVARVDLLLPLQLNAERMNNHGDENFTALARLKPGATIARAQAELNQAARGWSRNSRINIRPAAALASASGRCWNKSWAACACPSMCRPARWTVCF